MSLTFYYTPQSSAGRVLCSLLELGIPFEKVTLDLRAGDQKKPEFLALNPNGQVPTIVLDGTPVFESVAIQIALGERYGVEKGLWPALGSAEHLQALAWLTWGQVNLVSAVFTYFQNTDDYFPAELRNAKQAEKSRADLDTYLGILNNRLNGREYLVGDRFTLVDADLASVLGWAFTMIQGALTPFPNVAAWLGRVSERPAMKSAQAG
jgi:GST-like protein